MSQVRTSFSALVSRAAGLQLTWSPWLRVHRRVLAVVLLVLLVAGVLLIGLAHPALLLPTLAHPALTGPGCGPNCLLRA